MQEVSPTGSRDFERGTPNRIASSATGWSTGLTTLGVTMIGIATVEALPGAGSYQTLVSLTSGTAARSLYLGLAGDGGNALSAVFGSTQVDFGAGSGLVPTADSGAWPGTWYGFAATKATGTVAPVGYLYNRETNVLVTATAGGTAANRTAGAVTANVGSGNAADYWDGRIARVAIFEKVLNAGEILECFRFSGAWRRHKTPTGLFVDLTWRPGVMGLDECNPAVNFGAGTAPALTGHHPPGF